MSNLVIVESPAKAKTIEGYLGKDFKVLSSYGHIRDLSSKNMGVDVTNDFLPNYEVMDEKKKLITELKKYVKKSDTVWLATDEDREGEAIAWHLYEALGLEKKETKRIVFHEITKKAILHAIDNPRTINIDLVNAQQARRILDRLVGFELSPLLWKKVQRGLSAGRVQSVVVRLIVEKEMEIEAFKPQTFYPLQATVSVGDAYLQAQYDKKLKDREGLLTIMEALKYASLTVENLEQKKANKSPGPPFTTSTLQQEASRKLGFSVSRTMSVAQRLYESGRITYMRTDSVNLSQDAIQDAASFIEQTYGENYVHTRQYSTKAKGAQEAHEAIRPTQVSFEGGKLASDELKLYGLIRRRTLASQMAPAQFLRSKVTLSAPNVEHFFTARGEILEFDGYMAVYGKDGDNTILPPMKKGESFAITKAESKQSYTRHTARYNEASLVKKLEELGIGRPSTYAPTISTVQKRGYTVLEDREGSTREIEQFLLEESELTIDQVKENYGAEKKKFFPTDTGKIVNAFLSEHFEEILNYNFTAKVESLFDEIAEGDMNWTQMLHGFYSNFHKTIEHVEETAEKNVGQRELGVDPKTGKPVYARLGRFGPMVQLGETSDEEKPQFASIPAGKTIDNVTLEEALKVFQLPRQVGTYEEKVITAAIGRFGPYIRHNNVFVSLKEDSPYTVEEDRAIALIEEKRKKDEENKIALFDKEEPVIEVLKGRWGPYIKSEKKNYKIPKDTEADKLTREECITIMANQPAKGKRRAPAKTRKKKK